jgi:hypothetical protein
MAHVRQDSFWRRNGLSLVFGALMALTIAAHAMAGWRIEVRDARAGHEVAPTLVDYVSSPDFLSSLFENWESEFLQMALFVALKKSRNQCPSRRSRGRYARAVGGSACTSTPCQDRFSCSSS